jgi:ApaG protein
MPSITPLSAHIQIQTQVTYRSEDSRPADGVYIFSYRIVISNKSNETVQLLSRKWIITDAYGRTQEVQGAGVVGVQPKIPPNTSFEYESFCPLATPYGSMQGEYHMVSSGGELFSVPIPEFHLLCPQAIH